MMCQDSNSICEEYSDEYRIIQLQNCLRLLIAIVIRMILSVDISSNKTQRDC